MDIKTVMELIQISKLILGISIPLLTIYISHFYRSRLKKNTFFQAILEVIKTITKSKYTFSEQLSNSFKNTIMAIFGFSVFLWLILLWLWGKLTWNGSSKLFTLENLLYFGILFSVISVLVFMAVVSVFFLVKFSSSILEVLDRKIALFTRLQDSLTSLRYSLIGAYLCNIGGLLFLMIYTILKEGFEKYIIQVVLEFAALAFVWYLYTQFLQKDVIQYINKNLESGKIKLSVTLYLNNSNIEFSGILKGVTHNTVKFDKNKRYYEVFLDEVQVFSIVPLKS